MGRFVIVAYKPKDGKHAELAAVVAKHVATLAAENLVTDKSAYVMQAADGTIVEVFEWLSADAVERAHKNAAVQALWREFNAVCEYLPLARLPEAQQMFAEFQPLDMPAPE